MQLHNGHDENLSYLRLESYWNSHPEGYMVKNEFTLLAPKPGNPKVKIHLAVTKDCALVDLQLLIRVMPLEWITSIITIQ